MSSDSFGVTLQALARAHRARVAAALAPHGLHAGQEGLLLLLWDEPGMRQSSLAERLGVEPPTVTRMVQRLERSGLVERRRDPDDARAMRVYATPRSRLLESTVRRVWQECDAELAGALGTMDSAPWHAIAARALTRMLASS